jgi:hypothetical protein
LATSSKSTWILNQSKDSSKTDLNELWSDRLIEIIIANPSKFRFGQEVLHGDLKRLNYDLGVMHTLNINIKEDIEFQRGINVKLNPEKFSCLRIELYSSIWTLETNTSRHQ